MPPLRAQQQAIWQWSGDEAAAERWQLAGESAGLSAATDSLVDAINTAAHVLGADAAGQQG